jgi:branched-chain amino acid transport system permease protein
MDNSIFQHIANGLCLGAMYALLGLGFGFVYTTTRVFHLAQGGIYILTGYSIWLLLVYCEMSLIFSVFLSLAIAALVGVLIEWLIYQPLARRSATAPVVIISSLGVLIVIVNILILCFGNQPLFLRNGIGNVFNLGSVSLSDIQIAELICGSGLIIAFWAFLKYTRSGQICKAISDDRILAEVIGIKVSKVRLQVFAIGSIFVGIASILVSFDTSLDAHLAFPSVLIAAVVCVIGGMRIFLAPAVGGVIIGVLQNLIIWQTSSKWQEAITFGLLILFLLFRRQGLFGTKLRAEESI